MMNKFRTLMADEIDCRIAQIKTKKNEQTKKEEPTGLTLLLYKDARCDQNILDETVGAMNWERRHSRDNANCTVSIWDDEKQMWISKEDTGTESNTEKEKGLASDSFKRACFNWGIGRELYTAPFIWIKASDCTFTEYAGKYKCYDNFTVKDIEYNSGNIVKLRIKHSKTGKIVFDWNDDEDKPEAPDREPEPQREIRNDAPASVSKTDKLPSVDKAVGQAFESCMSEFMELFQTYDSQEALKKFNKFRKSLQDGGVLEKADKMRSAEEVAETFDAIYKNFRPSGEKA